MDVSLPEGHAAAWETIDETDLVARDVSSQRRKGRARTTRSLSDRDQRDLDNAIVMLTHHGVAIERALKASSSLESRVERLETWIEDYAQRVQDTQQVLDELDNKGTFEADDEIGVVFTAIKEAVDEINEITEKEL